MEKFYGGIDIHKENLVGCIMDKDGTVTREHTFPSSKKAVERFLCGIPSPGYSGTCTFYALNTGTYQYNISKTDYIDQYGDVTLTTDMKVIVVLEGDFDGAKIHATIYFQPGPIPKHVTRVLGSIRVYNKGSSGSKLDWMITEWPSFGENWYINPIGGVDLTPEYGSILVTVSYDRPMIPGVYTGRFVVQNLHNPLDYVILIHRLWVGSDQGSYISEIEISEQNITYINEQTMLPIGD